MNLTRSVAIGVCGGVVLTWWSWAATPTPRPVTVPAVGSRAVDRSAAELSREIARLHERLRPDVAPQYARNVFAFPTRASVAPGDTPVAAPPSTAATRRAPDLTLVGMAEDVRDHETVRTAVINLDGQIFLVKEGESLGTRYQVDRLSADAVELRDLETDSTVRLVLR
jgi:hypothetical protein